MNQMHLKLLYWIAIIAWFLILLLNGENITTAFFKPSSYVLLVLSFLIAIFDKWLWKWEKFYPWFVNIPSIQGSWKITIHSSWIDPSTGKIVPPITGFVAIEQTFNALKFRLMTEESTSQLVANSFLYAETKVCELIALYVNRPKYDLRGEKSEIHYGSVLIQISGNKPQKMEGHYWTDRKTSGSIYFLHRVNDVFGTFDEANAFFSKIK